MAGINLKLITGAVALLLTAPVHAQNERAATEAIERCRTIADAMDRLACYDRIGRAETAAAVAPAAAVEAVSTPQPTDQTSQAPEIPAAAAEGAEYGELTDDVGLPKSADDYKPIRVTVVRCGQSNDRKWYFYLDNGQVWKYLGARPLRYRSCDTPGMLLEDGMGFALQMDMDEKKHRVQRVR